MIEAYIHLPLIRETLSRFMLTKICRFLSSNLTQELQIVKELKIIIIKKTLSDQEDPPGSFSTPIT